MPKQTHQQRKVITWLIDTIKHHDKRIKRERDTPTTTWVAETKHPPHWINPARTGNISVREGNVLDKVWEFPKGRTAIVNMADSSYRLGGRVSHGYQTPEADLCLDSGLYIALRTIKDSEGKIRFDASSTPLTHRIEFNEPIYDALKAGECLVSENVPLLRDKEGYLLDAELTALPKFTCITAYPPHAGTRKTAQSNKILNENLQFDYQRYYWAIINRVHNILHAALLYKIDNLVIPAFGCGRHRCYLEGHHALHGLTAELVAEAFRFYLYDCDYKRCFANIEFMIQNDLNPNTNYLEIFKRSLTQQTKLNRTYFQNHLNEPRMTVSDATPPQVTNIATAQRALQTLIPLKAPIYITEIDQDTCPKRFPIECKRPLNAPPNYLITCTHYTDARRLTTALAHRYAIARDDLGYIPLKVLWTQENGIDYPCFCLNDNQLAFVIQQETTAKVKPRQPEDVMSLQNTRLRL